MVYVAVLLYHTQVLTHQEALFFELLDLLMQVLTQGEYECSTDISVLLID